MTQAANLAALGTNVNSTGKTSLTAGVTGVLPIANGGTNTSTGPSFSAYFNGDTTISSNTWTKLPMDTEEWDTASCYDTSLYRFTPNVAGYYFVEGSFYPYSGAGCSRAICYIWKNGQGHKAGNYIGTYNGVQAIAQVTSMVYMNGTTDYIELYGLATGTTLHFEGISAPTIEMHFAAFLARTT